MLFIDKRDHNNCKMFKSSVLMVHASVAFYWLTTAANW